MPTLFFEPPLNTTPVKLTDGRLDTFTTDTVLTFNVDALGTGVGDARPFTHIFMVSEGVSSYAIGATGGNVIGINVTLPTSLTDSSGYTVDPVIDGRHYDLFHWEAGNTKHTAQYLTITLTGSNTKVYQLYVLNAVLEIAEGGFSDIQFIEELAGFEQRSARGRRSVAPGIAGVGHKNRISLVAEPQRGDRTDKVARAVSAFMRKYPEFMFSLEPNRFPDMTFEAMNGERQVNSQFRSQWKALGRRTSFVIQQL